MAAACISVVSVSAGLLGAVSRDVALVRQTGRLALSAPSVSGASLETNTVGRGFFAPGGSRAQRNAAIAARASDLGQELELDFGDLSGFDTLEKAAGLPPLPESARMPPMQDSGRVPESVMAPTQPGSGRMPPEGTKLYVGNLPWSCHSKQLAEVFQGVGSVELVEVIYDRETQRSRGFAFVTMSTVEDANKAIESLDGYDLDGRRMRVDFPAATREGGFRERPPRPSFNSEFKLFVGNLSWGVDDVSLEELFNEYGKVVEAKVVLDRQTGRSRGFGFVTLSNQSEVDNAISGLDGAEFDGRQLRVNLAGDKPPPREPRDFMSGY